MLIFLHYYLKQIRPLRYIPQRRHRAIRPALKNFSWNNSLIQKIRTGTLFDIPETDARRHNGPPHRKPGMTVMSVKNIPSPLSLKGMARLRERMDDLSEALAYADAGETDLAREAYTRGSGHPRVVLAVSRHEHWSRELAASALGLAQRLGDALVLLNLTPRPDRAFISRADSAAEPWLRRASAEGVPARHHIQPGGMDAVSDVVRDMGRVDMVICALRDGVRLRGQLSIPVYCVRV